MPTNSTIFLPDVTPLDWAALAALLGLTLLCLGLGIWLVRASRRKSLRVGIAALGVLAFSLAGLASLMASKLPQFSRVIFSEKEVVVEGLASRVSLPLDRANSISSDGARVILVSGKQSAELPNVGSWRLDNLVVGAKYLANEFRGRSAYRD